MSGRKHIWFAALLVVVTMLVSACGSAPTSVPPTQPPAQAAQPTQAAPAQAPTQAPAQPTAPAPTAAAAAPTEAAKPVTYVHCMPGDAVKLDPGDFDEGLSQRVIQQIYEGLMEFVPGTNDVRPALAERYEANKDGTEWTFYLRKGVKFHDGTPFNADAVLVNFNRQFDPASPYHTKEYNSLEYEIWNEVLGWGFKGDPEAVLKDIVKVDDYTVKFILNTPNAVFLNGMAMSPLNIISPAALEKYKTDIFKNPVGTGPFKFVEWVKDDHITLEKNPDWWGAATEPVKLDRVIIRSIKDNSARFLAIKAGECDGMDGLNIDDLKAAQADESLQVIMRPAWNIGYVNFNQTMKPLDNANVRRAIAMAINRPAIIDALYGGVGQLATQLIPPSGLGWDPDLKAVPYDPEQAQKLLKEAGADNLSIDLWYMPVSRPYFPNPKAIAEAMAADLSKAGINVSLKTEDWGQYKTDLRDGKFQVWLFGWSGDTGDSSDFLLSFFNPAGEQGMKCCGYQNKELESQLLKAMTISDAKARGEAYRGLLQILDKDYPRIPVGHAQTPLVFSKKVSGYMPQGGTNEYLKTVSKAP